MGIMAGTGGSQKTYDFPPFPEDTHHAVLVDLIDLGIVEKTYAGETKKRHEVRAVWLVPEVTLPQKDQSGQDFGELAGRPRTVSQFLGVSLHEKATMRKMLRSVRGHDLTDEEQVLADEKRLDIEPLLLGLNALINVTNHTTKSGGVWPRIEGLPMKLMGSMKRYTLEELDYTRKSDSDTGTPAGQDDDDDLPF